MLRTLGLVLAGPALLSCSDGPPLLNYDRDTCEFCRMTLTDRRYGAALRVPGGRVYRFDTIDCLARWLTADPDRVASVIWVVDATVPGKLTELKSVQLLSRKGVIGPMGEGHLAVNRMVNAEDWGDSVVTWEGLLKAAAEAR